MVHVLSGRTTGRQLATSSFGLVNDLNERMIFGLPASEAIRK
jgi:hypothetical protein